MLPEGFGVCQPEDQVGGSQQHQGGQPSPPAFGVFKVVAPIHQQKNHTAEHHHQLQGAVTVKSQCSSSQSGYQPAPILKAVIGIEE